jgi:ureidoacrylate peracid hydrolase
MTPVPRGSLDAFLLGGPLDPRRTAVVVVDLQQCFVEPGSPLAGPRALELIPAANALTERCREVGVTVVFTAHVLRADHSNGGTLPALIPVVADGIIDIDADSARLHPDLVVGADDIVVSKPRFSAFAATDLELILRTRGVDTIAVAGTATEVCCESTARDAADRGLRVVFLSDVTASGGANLRDADARQAEALARVGTFFGRVASKDAFVASLA